MQAFSCRLSCLILAVLFFSGCDSLKKIMEKTPPPPSQKTTSTQPTQPPVSNLVPDNNAQPTWVDRSTPAAGVKTFYDAVAKEHFDVAWNSLTLQSQEKFINMIAGDEKLEPEKVRAMFEENQLPIRLGFWRSFRDSSKIDSIAAGAVYKVVRESGDQAEVELVSGTITLKSKAMKQHGQWKLGYAETFLTEK